MYSRSPTSSWELPPQEQNLWRHRGQLQGVLRWWPQANVCYWGLSLRMIFSLQFMVSVNVVLGCTSIATAHYTVFIQNTCSCISHVLFLINPNVMTKINPPFFHRSTTPRPGACATTRPTPTAPTSCWGVYAVSTPWSCNSTRPTGGARARGWSSRASPSTGRRSTRIQVETNWLAGCLL